ncbi:hypothetical protein C9374_000339 [Naegleria lovaniensis]|uniref:Uncharacterized protein n=1 Tax=Naegleria lovaniensis TaxID=51637 RepID=A0AA88KMF3_NAELO|nr:uncharacterized protein C9374_000339 [Naegleria lovaniensis]KAG2388900.1 hypothetical protein C9374_000339 [Naegleria lovaniensis]
MKEVIQIEALEIITERQVEYSQRFSPFYRSQVSLNHVHRAIPTGDWQWDGHGLSNEHHSPISNLKEFSIFTSSLTLVKIIPQLPKLTRLCLQVTGNLEIQIFDMASIISCTLHDLKYLRIELQGISHSLSKSGQKYPISIMNNIEQCVLNVRSLFASNYEDIVGAIVLFYIISFRGLFSFSCLYNDAFVQPLLDQANQSNNSVEELLEMCLDKVIQDCIFEEKSDQTFMANLKEAFIKEMIEKAIER